MTVFVVVIVVVLRSIVSWMNLRIHFLSLSTSHTVSYQYLYQLE